MSRETQYLKELCFFHAKNIAMGLRLSNAHSDYCKFIILGEGRSGSNFLRSLLNSHGQVIAFGELFRSHESIGWDLPPYDQFWQYEKLRRLFKANPVKFLEEKVFRRFPKVVAAVGFKMFYYHAKEGPCKMVWSYLKNQKNLKIIHLKRQNTLRLVLSLKKAFMTNKWQDSIGKDADKLSVYLGFDECLQRFQTSEDYKRHYDQIFRQNQMIEVIYEKLETSYVAEMEHVQDFLNLSRRSVKPSIYKQSNLPLSQAISNYYELKDQFSKTRWEVFFEE